MSWEAWGTPPDPEPNPCALCDNELGSSTDCKLCVEYQRAEKAESELMHLCGTLQHRVRILRSRPVYEGGNKANGVSVELLQAITLLAGTPGLGMEGLDERFVKEAEKALLTLDNAKYIFAPRPGDSDYAASSQGRAAQLHTPKALTAGDAAECASEESVSGIAAIASATDRAAS